MSSGIERLREHIAECDDCRTDAVPIERIDSLLGTSQVELDTASLSRQAFAAAQVALHATALRHFWRQVAAVVVLALLPLPVVLAYDAVLLRLLHLAASSLLSGAVANYLIFSYASSLLFLFAASYAAIPILMARSMLPQMSARV
jgi:hypothetical protein